MKEWIYPRRSISEDFNQNYYEKEGTDFSEHQKYKVYKGAYSNINQKGHILPRPNLILDQLAHKYRPFNTSFSL
ncbi:unnamed protein product [Gordionus sp. m RMFG-2023]